MERKGLEDCRRVPKGREGLEGLSKTARALGKESEESKCLRTGHRGSQGGDRCEGTSGNAEERSGTVGNDRPKRRQVDAGAFARRAKLFEGVEAGFEGEVELSW